MKISILLLIALLLSASTPAVEAYHRDLKDLREEVAPSMGISIPVEWKDLPQRLRALGVVDVTLLNRSVSTARGYGLTEEEQALFFNDSASLIRIDSGSKIFLMYVFWALAISNNNTLLDQYAHMFANYTSPVGSAKYGSVKILEFTPEQQILVEEVASNSYRPCCNVPAAVPDCSHGFAALGLIELLVSRGVSKEDIFKSLLSFNSYWFTDQYVDIALMVEEEGQRWREVNSTLILGYTYSSLTAYQTIKEYLVENNLYDPLARYRLPLTILLSTILISASLILGWLLWGRWFSKEESKGEGGVEAGGTEPPQNTEWYLVSTVLF